MSFPKWIYHKSHSPTVIEDIQSLESAIFDGWRESPADFLEAEVEDNKSVLVVKAKALGIEVDGRWSVERLKKEIDDHDH